jgi:hypothetical protein
MAQPTAFFTKARIFVSHAAVSSVSANDVGHIAPSSRLAASSKPNVAYRVFQRRREEIGFSYFVFGAVSADVLAPVVAELAER